jgi:hypothetical protein
VRDEFGADIAAFDPIEPVNGAVEREASDEIPSNSDPQTHGKSGRDKVIISVYQSSGP